MIGTLLKIAIIALFLTVYDLFIKPLYHAWLTSQGKMVGFGETLLGLFATLTASYVTAVITDRYVRRREG
jgi:predicted membrane protein